MNRLYRLHKPVDVHTINQTSTEALAGKSLNTFHITKETAEPPKKQHDKNNQHYTDQVTSAQEKSTS